MNIIQNAGYNMDDIDVENIMEKIKENIRKRKESGTYYTRDFDLYDTSMDKYNASSDINFINGKSNLVNFSYLIDSHRGHLGKLLVKGRHLVHEEAKRYVDPVFLMQSEWNAATARLIKENEIRVSSINERVSRLEQLVLSSNTVTKNKEDSFEELTEEKLFDTIHPHEYFLDIVQAYAIKSAGEKVPKILEIGIDSGAISIYLSRKWNIEVYGIESSIDALFHSLENNEKMGGSAKFMLIDYFDLNTLKDNYFDIAFSQSTLEHFDNQSIIELLSRQKNIAKYVIFSVKSVFSPVSGYKTGKKGRIDDWATFLNSTGFNVLQLEYYLNDQYILGIIGE
jgi:hypothetical protein